MAATNLFTSAKVVPTKQATSKSKKKHTAEITGLEIYAQIEAAIKTLEGLKETYRVSCETDMIDEFLQEGRAIHRRPENFEGYEGIATASCELRKRSVRSGLTEAEIDLLQRHDIEMEKVADTVETFIINPAYVNDGALLGKVSAAISKVKGVPEDFIQLQQGSYKTVPTEKALDQIFAGPSAEVTRVLIKVVGTLALKPKVADLDVAQALKDLAKLVEETETEEGSDD